MHITDIPPIGYFVIFAWLFALAIAANRLDLPTSVPQLVLLLTIGTWYFGDVLLNDYVAYAEELGLPALNAAWLQILIFLVAFTAMVPLLHSAINGKYQGTYSRFQRLLNGGVLREERFQRQLEIVTNTLIPFWIALMAWGAYRVQFDVVSLFFPYFGERANPWLRGRVSSGFTDSLLVLALNLHLFMTSYFGLVAAIGRGRAQKTASLLFLLSAPYFVFGRARNTMLAVLLPPIAGWIAFRLRASFAAKLMLAASAFMLVTFWFGFVMANRSRLTISQAFSQLSSGDLENRFDDPHAGLNMFKELCWINTFIAAGTYKPNMGQRYFSEIVNPIPRAVWPEKPYVGIDYAIARGQESEDDTQAGVSTSVSTGMIGQGVVNFGIFVGPIAAAFLASVWVATLARQDILSSDPGRFALYCIGCVITFNLGRDITLMTIYPFFFGWGLLVAYHRFRSQIPN